MLNNKIDFKKVFFKTKIQQKQPTLMDAKLPTLMVL